MKAELRKITKDDHAGCLALQVAPEQSCYIASNEVSLRVADENAAVARPFAIYVDGQIVGLPCSPLTRRKPLPTAIGCGDL